MRWPSKNPDDYMTTSRWGDGRPGPPPLRFAALVLLACVAFYAALAWLIHGDLLTALAAAGASSPAAVQAAWWLRHRHTRPNHDQTT